MGCKELDMTEWLTLSYLTCIYLVSTMCLVSFHTVHTIHGVLKARILKWFAIPFSRGPCFVRTLHHDPSVLSGPPRHGSEFHWVRQGCGPCDQIGYFFVIVIFSLSALWWRRKRGLWKLFDGRDWGGKEFLFWWMRPCSVNLKKNEESRENH